MRPAVAQEMSLTTGVVAANALGVEAEAFRRADARSGMTLMLQLHKHPEEGADQEQPDYGTLEKAFQIGFMEANYFRLNRTEPAPRL